MVKKSRDDKNIKGIFARYIILLLLGLFLPVFYKIFLPLTLWPVYFMLRAVYSASVVGNVISIAGNDIAIIDACVAGSAYYLLLILNLTTRIKAKQRFNSLLFSFSSLLILNILRIFFLSILLVENFAFFDITHKLFWYAISIIFVVGIWFMAVWLFKIKNVPVYDDIQEFM